MTSNVGRSYYDRWVSGPVEKAGHIPSKHAPNGEGALEARESRHEASEKVVDIGG